jgi:hypothetical protein
VIIVLLWIVRMTVVIRTEANNNILFSTRVKLNLIKVLLFHSMNLFGHQAIYLSFTVKN